MKAAADYSLQLNTAKSEMLVLSDNLEKEKANKEKLEAKVKTCFESLDLRTHFKPRCFALY